MSLRILRAAGLVETDPLFHEARLLLLLRSSSKRAGGSIKGIMKLAKLDFFLRYPAFLRRLVAQIVREGKWKKPPALAADAFEEDTVESKMIRFKYGPWDHRYRTWIGLLHAKGLVDTYMDKGAVYVVLTAHGKDVADEIAEREEFRVLSQRSDLVCRAVGPLSATRLKNLVYLLVPELTGMHWGEEIAE